MIADLVDERIKSQWNYLNSLVKDGNFERLNIYLNMLEDNKGAK